MALILESHRYKQVKYQNVVNGPGARGLIGEKFFYTPYYKMLFGQRYSWQGASMAFKTTPVDYNEGNLPLSTVDGFTPLEKIPRCIIVNFINGHVLNAVALSSPGLEALLAKGVWQTWPEPFFISFAAVGATLEDRLNEAQRFVDILKSELPYFQSPVAAHINFGCPNVNLNDRDNLLYEVIQTMHLFRGLNIPLLINFGPTVKPELIATVAKSKNCDGFWLAGSYPWDELADIIKRDTFHTLKSPLAKRGFTSGGLSGPRCLPFVLNQLRQVRALGVTKPIIAGGGVQSKEAVRYIFDAQADAVALGIIGSVRPCCLQEVICYANSLFG